MDIFIIRNGEQTGPFSRESVDKLLSSGGLLSNDLAWRKGLNAWLPLSDALKPGDSRMDVPPPMAAASTVRKHPATAKQKALLKYLGAAMNEDIAKDEAALAISEAIENPKMAARFTKWPDDRTRKFPEVFQDEIDYRRATRVARYLELCQTEAAEVVKDVTKAHVQVLIESLDKRQSSWEQEPKTALWDYLLPTVAEHFPQLVQPDWKNRLKFGGAPKIAASFAGSGTLAPPPSPGIFQSAFRGLVYGVAVLGVVIGGIFIYQNQTQPSGTDNANNTVPKSPAHSVAAQPATPEVPGLPALPPENPPVASNDVPPNPPPASTENPPPVVAATTPKPQVNEPPVAPAPVPAPAPAPTPAVAFTPAPPPPGSTPAAPVPVPAAPAAPAAPAPAPATAKDNVTLTASVAVQLQFGKVTLNPGTRVRLIAVEGTNARVNFNNNIILIPLAATDVDPATAATAALSSPPPALPPPAVTPATPPVAPPAPKPPASDL